MLGYGDETETENDNNENEKKAEINVVDEKFWVAVSEGQISDVHIFLADGADINFQNPNDDNKTALMCASVKNFVGIVNLLIRKGANLDLQTNEFQMTALMFASVKNNTEVVKSLLKAGCDPNLKNSFGMTALISASGWGHTEVVEDLIRAGCDVDVQDDSGRTALSRATQARHQRVIEILSSPQHIDQLRQEGYLVQPTKMAEFENLKNCYDVISSCTKTNKLKFPELYSELEINIEKSFASIEHKIPDHRVIIEKKEKLVKTKNLEFQNHLQTIQNIKKQLASLEAQIPIFENEKVIAMKELDDARNDLDETIYFFEKGQEIMNKISSLKSSTITLIDNWKDKVKQGKIETWGDEELELLLEELKLNNWFESIKSNKLSVSNILSSNPNHLMKIQQNNGSTMSFGNANFIWLAIKQIKTKKTIPIIQNDLDLNETNICSWTVDDVVTYFNKKNLSTVANALSVANVNGFVLTNLKENEIEYLNISSVEDLSEFKNLLKTLQKNFVQKFPPECIICPLSKQVMTDPVNAKDGFIYERSEIEKWFLTHNTSPKTEQVIDQELTPNEKIKKYCSRWHVDQSELWDIDENVL